jgi:phage terminase small subunit
MPKKRPLLGWESEMGLPPWESEKKLAIISYQDNNNNNNIKNKFDIYTFGT